MTTHPRKQGDGIRVPLWPSKQTIFFAISRNFWKNSPNSLKLPVTCMSHEDIFLGEDYQRSFFSCNDKKPDLNRCKQKREHASLCTQAVQRRLGCRVGGASDKPIFKPQMIEPGPSCLSFSQACLQHSELPLCKVVANRSQGKRLLGSNTEGKRELWPGTPRQSPSASHGPWLDQEPAPEPIIWPGLYDMLIGFDPNCVIHSRAS